MKLYNLGRTFDACSEANLKRGKAVSCSVFAESVADARTVAAEYFGDTFWLDRAMITVTESENARGVIFIRDIAESK